MTGSCPGGVSYRTILLDPPWMERGGGQSKRGADRHYPLMHARDMPALIKGSGVYNPAPDAHMYMWVTDNFMPDGLFLMNELGFRYVRACVWVKLSGQLASSLQVGLGQYLRGAHELMLFGVKGRGLDPAVYTGRRDLPSVIFAPRGRHSQKPEASYELIEARSHGPRIEFFARTPRQGWDCWGNEVP